MRARIVTVWVLATIGVLFLLFDATIHITKPQPVVDSFAELGMPLDLSVALGLLEIALVAFYPVPRTSLLGAVLLTGYFGGAVATNLRVGKPLFSTILFPVYLGILLSGSLWLPDARVRGALAPAAPEVVA